MNKDTATSRRVQRGIILAACGAVSRQGAVYRVQGQGGVYVVDLDRQYCSCPDRAEVCKYQVVDSREACRWKKTAKPKTDRRHKADGEGLRGIMADPAALDRVADKLNV